MAKNTFGYRLKQLRKEKKLYQEDIAKLLNVTKSTVSRYENNILEANYETLDKLSNFFGVTPNYLLGTEQRETHSLPIEQLNDIEQAYLNKLIQEINDIMRRNSITNILALKSILTSDYTLEQLKNFLLEFEKMQKSLSIPQKD